SSRAEPPPLLPPRSLPTRRSSDLPDSAFRILYQVQNVFSVKWIKSDFMPVLVECRGKVSLQANVWKAVILTIWIAGFLLILIRQDRKSTRLNSSHVSISYAVFCLL